MAILMNVNINNHHCFISCTFNETYHDQHLEYSERQWLKIIIINIYKLVNTNFKSLLLIHTRKSRFGLL